MPNYQKLGFKCGIEIHQQLNTTKLFCKCPSEIRKDTPDFTINRSLRVSAGETGKVDIAAKHESKKAKSFLYQGYYDTTCLVEADDEPPNEVNHDALLTTLQVSKLLNAKIVDKIQFMRKVVIDGSNVSGFQRTALVARNGYITIQGKKINIPAICLEEEACQTIKRSTNQDIYNLSRLGIPLIEIATSPDIVSPKQCKVVAEHLGMILRSTNKVKRGIGTIRQDVNVSIKKGARVEVKGFQDLRNIPKVINYEVERQLSLAKKGKRVLEEVRKAEPNLTTSFLRPMPGASRMYPETDIMPIEVTKELLLTIPKITLIKDQIKKLQKKYGLTEILSSNIIKLGIDIDAFIENHPNINANFIAQSLIEFPKEIKKRYNLEVNINLFEIPLNKLGLKEITREAVFEIMIELAKGKKPNYNKYKPVSEKETLTDIKNIILKNKGASINALMGQVMSKYRGKIDGKKVMQLLKKHT